MNTHTHTKTPKTVIKQQSNNAYKLFITWHEFKPSFCLLLLLTAVHIVSPCSFCFLFCALFLQPNLMSTPESVPTLSSFLLVSSGGSGAADFPLLCPPPWRIINLMSRVLVSTTVKYTHMEANTQLHVHTHFSIA